MCVSSRMFSQKRFACFVADFQATDSVTWFPHWPLGFCSCNRDPLARTSQPRSHQRMSLTLFFFKRFFQRSGLRCPMDVYTFVRKLGNIPVFTFLLEPSSAGRSGIPACEILKGTWRIASQEQWWVRRDCINHRVRLLWWSKMVFIHIHIPSAQTQVHGSTSKKVICLLSFNVCPIRFHKWRMTSNYHFKCRSRSKAQIWIHVPRILVTVPKSCLQHTPTICSFETSSNCKQHCKIFQTVILSMHFGVNFAPPFRTRT